MSETPTDANLLRMFIREHAPGGCKMLTLGDACKCPLCRVDKLELALAAAEQESEGRRATLMIVREQQIADWKRAEAAEARAREAELVLLSVAQDDCPRPVLDDPSIRACIEGGKCGCYWETCNIMKAALALGEQGREKG